MKHQSVQALGTAPFATRYLNACFRLRLDRPEFAVDEAAQGPTPIRFNSDQQARSSRIGKVVREGLIPEKIRNALSSLWRIHRCEARRERLRRRATAQSQDLRSLQEWLNGPAQSRPKLDLPSNGPFKNFRCETRIKH
jgi:hypothetical protein